MGAKIIFSNKESDCMGNKRFKYLNKTSFVEKLQKV